MKQKKILIFNKHKKLVLVACSINEAARYANVPLVTFLLPVRAFLLVLVTTITVT